MLYLNRKDISKLINYNEVVMQIERAFDIYEKKQFTMPDRIHAMFNDETYLYMPCFTDKIKGTKVLTLFPDNPKKNMEVIQGLMILNDTETGKTKCILDGAAVTAYRTGAVGGVGIKYTSKESCKTLGIIGAGVQGFHQALYGATVRKLKTIYVYDLNRSNSEKFKQKIKKELPYIEVINAISTEDLLKNCEIIITTTTSQKPVIPNDIELLKNKHFIGIGSYKPFMQEYPEKIYKLIDKVYIDVEFAKQESGDLCIPLDKGWLKESQVEMLSRGIKNKNINKNTTTFYKSVGMALFDIIVANFLYTKALKENIGQLIED